MISLLLRRYFEKRSWASHAVTRHWFLDAPRTDGMQENNLAAVLICKDEEDYIDEWIRYHVLAGVRHFYIYDNDYSSGNTAAKALAHNRGGVAVIVNPWKLKASAGECAVSPQQAAYAHAALCYGHMHRWMAFIDIDEFIVPRQHATIIEALAHLKRHSNISLPWSQFGHCGHETKPTEPCAFAYMLRHQPDQYHNYHFKCIINPTKLSMVYTHYCMTTDMGTATSNDKGQVEENLSRQSAAGFISSEFLQLNHYQAKSIQELHAKLEQTLHGELEEERKHRVEEQVRKLSGNVVEDTAIVDFLSRHGINNSREYMQWINGED